MRGCRWSFPKAQLNGGGTKDRQDIARGRKSEGPACVCESHGGEAAAELLDPYRQLTYRRHAPGRFCPSSIRSIWRKATSGSCRDILHFRLSLDSVPKVRAQESGRVKIHLSPDNILLRPRRPPANRCAVHGINCYCSFMCKPAMPRIHGTSIYIFWIVLPTNIILMLFPVECSITILISYGTISVEIYYSWFF